MTLTFRFTEDGDAIYLKQWWSDPATLQWFPMANEAEIDDSVRVWISVAKNKAGLTALWDGTPCGMVTVYPSMYKKLSHQSLVSIIVDKNHRNKGIGFSLLQKIAEVAKNDFHIELLHLEVYEGNPAKRLYERLGFVEYGRDPQFVKENGKYLAKVCMEKWI